MKNVIPEVDSKSMDIVADNVSKLKELFPEVFTEGKVDFDSLKEVLGSYIDGREERYSFTWNGKSKARMLAQTPSTGTLRPCKEESVDWDTTQNLFIEGDNLEVLKLLQKSYHKKVKMIYIDPPYNTGKDFVYKDNFKDNIRNYKEITGQVDGEGRNLSNNPETSGRYHTDWLNMMYPRLKLARNLLKDNGVIFISIDDNELFNLSKICDEIFGEENYVGLLSIENNPKGRKNSKFVSVSNDYCLIYAKEKESAFFVENIPKGIDDMVLDEDGNYIHGSGKRVLVGENSFNNFVTDRTSDKHYSVYYSQADQKIEIIKEEDLNNFDRNLVEKGFERYISSRNGKFIENTYSKSKLMELYLAGALEFKSGKIFEKNFSSTIRIKSMVVNRSYDAVVDNDRVRFKIDVKTTSAGTYLKDILGSGDSLFDAPKNVGLIKLLATLFDEKDFLVVDFFAGSGTVADALMQQNSLDKGARRYVLVQLPEICGDKSEAYKAGYKTISEISKERIRRVAAKIKAENPDYQGDLGFKVFKLDSTNIKPWELDFDLTEQDLVNQISNIKNDRNEEDVLYEVLLKYGLDLSLPITEHSVAGHKVFDIGMGALMICLSDDITLDVVEGIAKLKDELKPEIMRVVFKDAGFADDVVKTNAVQILKQVGIEDVRSL